MGKTVECTPSFEIMVTDDSEAEGLLIREVFLNMRGDLVVSRAFDGKELLDILNSRLESNVRLPDLILLDLNMPRLNGRKALKILKDHDRLKQIPVIIFTCSNDPSDVQACYSSQASGFITKPWTLEGYEAVLRSVDRYWLNTCELPSKNEVSI